MTDATRDSVEADARVLLAHVAEPGDPRLGAAVARWGSAEVLDRVRAGDPAVPSWWGARLLATAPTTAGEARERAASLGARIVVPGGAEWPRQLDDLDVRAPMALWIAGSADLRLLALRSLAMVGARACSSYGERVALDWAGHLAGERWTVVSGAAFGIDAAAHRGALAADGTTIAVLASGIDVAYPRAHDALLARIADSGCLVSEVPPGEPARRQRFLTRNRVIAALSRATLVVEAATRSGSLATARAAAALGRIVLAVPGPVTSATSAGCHRLVVEERALLAAGLDDVRMALDLTSAGPGPAPPGPALSADERAVLDAIPARGASPPDRIAAAAAVDLRRALTALGRLETGGWVARSATGWSLTARARLPVRDAPS